MTLLKQGVAEPSYDSQLRTYEGELAKENDNNWVADCYAAINLVYSPILQEAQRVYDEDRIVFNESLNRHWWEVWKRPHKKSFDAITQLGFAERMYNIAWDIYYQAVKNRFKFIVDNFGIQSIMSGYPAMSPKQVKDLFPDET